MNIRTIPDTLTRLTQLGDVTQYEPAGDTPHRERLTLDQAHAPDPKLLPCVSHVTTPQGLKPVMKSMITTACEKNCHYCPFRAGRDKMARVTFTPDDMAAAFHKLERAKVVDGIFLSSGIIKGGAAMQDRIIDAAEIIRRNATMPGLPGWRGPRARPASSSRPGSRKRSASWMMTRPRCSCRKWAWTSPGWIA